MQAYIEDPNSNNSAPPPALPEGDVAEVEVVVVTASRAPSADGNIAPQPGKPGPAVQPDRPNDGGTSGGKFNGQVQRPVAGNSGTVPGPAAPRRSPGANGHGRFNYRSFSERTHLMLELGSLWPGAGTVFSAIDTVLYVGEAIYDFGHGDTKSGLEHLGGAALSGVATAASVIVPDAGAIRLGLKAGVKTALQASPRATNVAAQQALRQARISQEAAGVAQQAGRNRVTAKTPNGRWSIDLAGKPHYVKKTGETVPTPHVKFQELHVGPNGKGRLVDAEPRPATMDDVRTARKILKRGS